MCIIYHNLKKNSYGIKTYFKLFIKLCWIREGPASQPQSTLSRCKKKPSVNKKF